MLQTTNVLKIFPQLSNFLPLVVLTTHRNVLKKLMSITVASLTDSLSTLNCLKKIDRRRQL